MCHVRVFHFKYCPLAHKETYVSRCDRAPTFGTLDLQAQTCPYAVEYKDMVEGKCCRCTSEKEYGSSMGKWVPWPTERLARQADFKLSSGPDQAGSRANLDGLSEGNWSTVSLGASGSAPTVVETAAGPEESRMRDQFLAGSRSGHANGSGRKPDTYNRHVGSAQRNQSPSSGNELAVARKTHAHERTPTAFAPRQAMTQTLEAEAREPKPRERTRYPDHGRTLQKALPQEPARHVVRRRPGIRDLRGLYLKHGEMIGDKPATHREGYLELTETDASEPSQPRAPNGDCTTHKPDSRAPTELGTPESQMPSFEEVNHSYTDDLHLGADTSRSTSATFFAEWTASRPDPATAVEQGIVPRNDQDGGDTYDSRTSSAVALDRLQERLTVVHARNNGPLALLHKVSAQTRRLAQGFAPKDVGAERLLPPSPAPTECREVAQGVSELGIKSDIQRGMLATRSNHRFAGEYQEQQ